MAAQPPPAPPGCLGLFFRVFQQAKQLRGSEKTRAAPIDYHRRDYLFTAAERSFFGVLERAVDGKYRIFAKVRLADLLWIPKGTGAYRSLHNRIQSKHIDYVLCDPDRVRPELAIELDDASHERASRRTRDAFVDEALASAGLPLLRIRARRAYNVDEVQARIAAALGANQHGGSIST